MLANDDADDNAPGSHWNPQLVAQLEAERARGLPRRPQPVDNRDTPAEIAKRRKIALDMMKRTR